MHEYIFIELYLHIVAQFSLTGAVIINNSNCFPLEELHKVKDGTAE